MLLRRVLIWMEATLQIFKDSPPRLKGPILCRRHLRIKHGNQLVRPLRDLIYLVPRKIGAV